MAATLAAILIVGLTIVILNPEYWPIAVTGGCAFAILYFGIMFMSFRLWPGFLEQWNLPKLWGLAIDGVPLGKTGPVVHYSFPANSSPGEIYPSGVDVPEAGCWAFTLRFAGQTAQIELAYR